MSKASATRQGAGTVAPVKVLPMTGPQRTRVGMIVSAAILALAGCTGTPMAVTELSASLAAELAATSQEAPVALAGGFAPAVARAVETNAGYRAALAQEREAASRVGVPLANCLSCGRNYTARLRTLPVVKLNLQVAGSRDARRGSELMTGQEHPASGNSGRFRTRQHCISLCIRPAKSITQGE